MSDYFLAPSLVKLRTEVNDRYPARDKSSDGWIGDASHAARESDHNPDWHASGRDYGIVRAIDIDNNGKPGELTPLVKDVLAAAIGDQRVWYVIYNRKIYSRTYGWEPRNYTGINPHDHHIHVSILHTDSAAWDTSTWLKPKQPIKTLPTLSLANAKNAAKHPRKPVNPVATRRIQKALNEEGFDNPVDGVFGKSTRVALKGYKKKIGKPGKTGYPGIVVLSNLGKGRWRLVR